MLTKVKYKISWRNINTGVTGSGEAKYTLPEAEKIATRLNKEDGPNVMYWVDWEIDSEGSKNGATVQS